MKCSSSQATAEQKTILATASSTRSLFYPSPGAEGEGKGRDPTLLTSGAEFIILHPEARGPYPTLQAASSDEWRLLLFKASHQAPDFF